MDMLDTARRALGLLDLTSLGADDTDDIVRDLCARATTAHGSVAAVCVWPQFTATAVAALSAPDDESARVPVAAVANFPAGDDDVARAVADAESIVAQGGTEVDVVFPWRSLRDGMAGVGEALVRATRKSMPDGTLLKVILESGELDDPILIEAAAREAIAGGADFLKTSTGKTARSATPEAVRQLFTLVAAADRPIGVKVSGGVRTVADAATYLAIADEILGVDNVGPATMRIGASSLLGDILATLGDSEAGTDDSGY